MMSKINLSIQKKMVLLMVFMVLVSYSSLLLAGGEEELPLEYPLVVYGGEPEGVMAAIAAARHGVKTLLIMPRENPGGLMTYGGLNYLDLNHGPGGRSLNRGLFAEWHRLVGGKVNFSIDRAINVFNLMLAEEENLDVFRETDLTALKVEGDRIIAIKVISQGKSLSISTRRVIDASQDASLAIKAGALSFEGGADIGLPDRKMAVTQILHLGGVNWWKILTDIRSQKFGLSYLQGEHAWGFVEIGRLYKPHDPLIKLRGLNIVRDRNDEVYINSMLVFGVDPLDPASLQDAYDRGKLEARYVLSFLRENLAGFEQAELLAFPPELYVREGRHIVGSYQLQAADLMANRIFADTITLASYPLDYQASSPDYQGFVLFNPELYGIPLRSLLSVNISNLMVVGRSSGYSSLAAASARVLPTGMNTGEAAGLAAALSLDRDIDLKELSNDRKLIAVIQRKLGIEWLVRNLSMVGLPGLINDDILKPYLEELLSWGLVIGGYQNTFQLDKAITEREFAHIIVKGLKRREAPIFYDWVPGGLETMSSQQPLTRNQAAMLLLVAVSKNISNLKAEQYYQKALENSLIPGIISEHVPENRVLSRREAYILLGNFLQQYPLPEDLKKIRGQKG